jgi:hypothetical protein
MGSSIHDLNVSDIFTVHILEKKCKSTERGCPAPDLVNHPCHVAILQPAAHYVHLNMNCMKRSIGEKDKIR